MINKYCSHQISNPYKDNINFQKYTIPTHMKYQIKSEAVYRVTNRTTAEIRDFYPENLINRNELINKKVLDVGAGSKGRFVLELKMMALLNHKRAEIYGIDTKLNPIYKLLFKSCLKEANAQKIPFQDNTFDVVYSTQSMFSYNQEKKEIKIAVLKEIYRVLKPNGLFRCAKVNCKEMTTILNESGLNDKFVINLNRSYDGAAIEFKKLN